MKMSRRTCRVTTHVPLRPFVVVPFPATGKFPDKSGLRKKRSLLALSLSVQPIGVGKPRQQEHVGAAGDTAPVVKKHRKMASSQLSFSSVLRIGAQSTR